MNDLVSVIIVNLNGKIYLENCLSSLFNQTYNNFEVVFVDNNSTDGSVEYISNNFPQVKIIRNNSNMGFAEGNNIGIRESTGTLIALLNNDTEVHKDWLKNLVLAVNKSDKIAGASGKIFFLDNKEKIAFTTPQINPYTALGNRICEDCGLKKVDYLSGNAMMVKKAVIDELGLLDKDYFAYYEETDWCARMIRAGYDLIYTPDAIIWHKEFGTKVASDFYNYMMVRNRIRFVIKNFDLIYIIFFGFLILKEYLIIFYKNLLRFNFYETRIFIRALLWNIINLHATIKARKHDLSRIKNIRSFNKSLPSIKWNKFNNSNTI